MVSSPPVAVAAASRRGSAARLATDLAWTLAGQALAALGVLAGFRLLTEVLPPAVFGTVSLLTALGAFARALAGFPVLQAGLRHFPETAGAGRPHLFAAVMQRELARAAAVAIGIAAVAGLVGRVFFHASAPAFLLLGAFLAVDLARNFFADVLNAGRRHALYAGWAAAESWLRPLLGVSGALVFGPTAEAVLLGYLAAALALGALMALSSPLRGALRRAPQVEEAPGARDALRRSMRRYALPLVPLALFGWATSVGDRSVIGLAQGAGAVGLYAAAYGLVNAPFAAAQAVIELALRPAYFQAASAADHGHERRLLGLWVALSAAVAAAGAGAFAWLHAPLAAAALGAAYRGGSALMVPIAAGLGLWLVAAALEKACYAHKLTGGVLAAQGAGAAAFLIVTPPLVRAHGPAGAAEAVPVYFFVQLLASLMAAWRALRARP